MFVRQHQKSIKHFCYICGSIKKQILEIMKILFFITALIVLFSINGLAWLRGWQVLPEGSIFRPIYLATMVLLFATLFIGMTLDGYMPLKLAKVVTFIGYTYFIVLIYLLISFLLVDLVRVLNYLFHFAPAGMEKFRLITFLASLAIVFVLLVVGNYNFNHPKVVQYSLESNKPKQNKSIKIVVASDIHLGVSIDKERLKSYVDLINNQHPDMVLFAGDVSDRPMKPVKEQKMEEEFRQIKSKFGVFAINGNHELYAEKPNATASYLQSAGINVLMDQSFLVDSSLYVVGREDRSNLNRKSVSEITLGLDKKFPVIMMDHQPYHLEQVAKENIDLQVSGHTHSGQFFPVNLIVSRMYELAHGYLKKENSHFIVSSGLGIWGPQYRIGTQSEIVVIDFQY